MAKQDAPERFPWLKGVDHTIARNIVTDAKGQLTFVQAKVVAKNKVEQAKELFEALRRLINAEDNPQDENGDIWRNIQSEVIEYARLLLDQPVSR